MGLRNKTQYSDNQVMTHTKKTYRKNNYSCIFGRCIFISPTDSQQLWKMAPQIT